VRERPRKRERGHAYACEKAGEYSKFQEEMEQFRLPRQVCVGECVCERDRGKESTRIRVRERGRLLKNPAGNEAVPLASPGERESVCVRERPRERERARTYACEREGVYSKFQRGMEQFRLPRQVRERECVCVRDRGRERARAYACESEGVYSKFQRELEQFRLPR